MESIFKENPQLKVVFVTSDGQAFYQETDAKNHARSLEDKTVEPVYNPNHLEVIAEAEDTNAEDEMKEFLLESAAKANEEKPAAEDATTTEEAAAAEDVASTDEAPVTEEVAATEEAPTEEEVAAAPAEDAKTTKVDLSDMTKKQLLQYAKENEMTIANPTATNAVLIAEIESQLKDKK